MKFRLSSRKLYLTYSQIDDGLTKQEILEQLQTKLEISDYVIALEKHKDEGIHCHALLYLTKKCDIKNAHYLDIQYNNKTFHGNYQSVKNKNAVIRYIVKENNYIKSNGVKIYTDDSGELINLEHYILLQARHKGLKYALQQYIDEDINQAIKKINKLQRNMNIILDIQNKLKQNN